MASTAATVFFCRPGRMSRRAELTGSFIGAGVVCATAEAASNSEAGIIRVVFILYFVLISFWSVGRAAAATFPDISHHALSILLLTEHMPRRTSVRRKSDMRRPK